MNNIDYQQLYYQLAEKELRHLQTLVRLTDATQAQVSEFLDHNELGLAFETLKDAAENPSEEAAQQIAILDSFLQS